MSCGQAVREELRVPSRELRHAIPQVYAGYKQLHDSALGAGALDERTRELIALAIRGEQGMRRVEGAENLRHLGKCLAERGWAFGAWPTCGACRVVG